MADILSILSDCEALLSGHFLLSSGKHSSQYFQCARLLQHPDKAAIVLAPVTEKIRSEMAAGRLDANVIVGPAMGGIIVAYELGRQLGLPAIFTERNDEGVMTVRRGFEIRKGDRIIIAEDVVTTGKSTMETANELKKLGGEVVASICVVDRRPADSPEAFPWPLFPAFRQPAEIWDAAECPLCKAGGEPPVKPGSRKVF